MPDEKVNENAAPVARRNFLLGAGTAVAAGLAPGSPGSAEEKKAAVAPAAAADPEAFVTLTAAEAAFIVAAVDTLIPADELSPSGSDCGVAIFIDRQLGSAWGGGSKIYRSGPFIKGKPEQGYQLALTPREFFAAGIAATNDWTRKTYGKDFDRLTAAERIAALEAIEAGKAALENFDAAAFFGQLHAITMAGFFSDPIHGGNRNKVGWKLIGFPGAIAVNRENVQKFRDKKFPADPIGIGDMS